LHPIFGPGFRLFIGMAADEPASGRKYEFPTRQESDGRDSPVAHEIFLGYLTFFDVPNMDRSL